MTERKFTPPTEFPAEYAMNDVDGTRVTLIGEGVGEFPYVGQDEDGYWRIFRRDGRNSTCAQYGLYDLPKTNVQWANDYEEIFGCTWHDSREEADANAMWDCIAVIRREWTEGQPPEYFTEEARMSNDLVKRLRHPVGGMRPTISDGRAAADRIEELEAELAKSVELALEECPFRCGTPNYDNWWRNRRATLAEIKGGKDGN